jgi:FkbM family methyltransferase
MWARKSVAAIAERATYAFLHSYCRIRGGYPSVAKGRAGYSVVVLAGPLRGVRFHTPKLERPSFALGTYERHVVSAIRDRLSAGSVAYDVGANAGYMALVMADSAPDVHVIAFEPDARNLAALAVNAAGRANISIVPSAVADVPGVVRLATFEYSLVSQLERHDTAADAVFVDVPSVSLDDFVFRDGNPPPDLIKIDVEGAEALVFEGARRLLREKRPVIVAEIRASAWPLIRSLIEPSGYQWSTLGAGEGQLETMGIADMLLVPRS